MTAIPDWPAGLPDDPAAAATVLNDYLGELATAMGVRMVEFTPQRSVARMPVEGNRQPLGLLHGGASGVLAETIGSIHASVLAGTGRIAVGIELSCSHHRSARAGSVSAVCTPLQAGRTLTTFHIAIADDDARPVCTARLSCLTRPLAAGPADGQATPR